MFQFLLRLMQHTKWICSKYIFKNKTDEKQEKRKEKRHKNKADVKQVKKAQNECEQVKKRTKNFLKVQKS